MRRLDPDNHGPRTGQPPFRVLSGGGHCLLSPSPPSPPPPRAPEPYKIVPPCSSYTRAHRRSSFVIIAETRPITPDSRSPSPPCLATGRVSPFRGRGFKGPLPHAQSRPESPNHFERHRSSRFDRRVSVSQQCSPKRSQIPQPTRSRSISLTKRNEKKQSPKFGRRAISKDNVTITHNVNGNRRQSLKRPGLSPIQGTPTKPREKSPEKQIIPKTRSQAIQNHQRTSSQKARRNSLLPPKIITKSNNKSSDKQKSSSTEILSSPSKIPLRRESISNKSASTQSLSSNKPSAPPPSLSVKPTKSLEKIIDKAKKIQQKPIVKKTEVNVMKNLSLQVPKNKKNIVEKAIKKLEKKSSVVQEAVKILEDDLKLAELLKQSSGATGTSSVVNTTTTTAVQPLQIDATAINSEKENVAKIITGSENQKKNNEIPVKKNGDKEKNKTVESSSSLIPKNADQKTAQVQETNTKQPATTILGTTISTPDSKNTTPDDVVMLVVNSSGNQAQNTIKNVAKNSNELPNESQQLNVKVSTTVNDSKINDKSEDSIVQNKMENIKERTKGDVEIVNEINKSSNKRLEANVQGTEHQKTESINKNSDLKSDQTPSNIPGLVTTSLTDVTNNSNVNNSGVEKIRNQGSGVSMKSSAGKSSDSVESIRSTDTGVSLNTVRGVSSAREKKGVHMEKRTQEIETLSGNVGHLERNGEPSVLTASDNIEGGKEKLATRWKKSLGRYCKCWPGMKCLACRRDHPKGKLWPRKQLRTISKAELTPTPRGNEDKGPGKWSRLKAACRCPRWKERKWCMRKARVAPAESKPCCPPERRFGALCRRLFANCKCKRSNNNNTTNNSQRRKSIRAKHSITSVVAPPVSEELRPKLPDVLVEHNSLMRGAIPCLPIPLAWFCFVWNLLIPGSGTFWSGLFNLCVGQPRFSPVASGKARFGAFIVNLFVGVGQLFTILFCLVGWGWSIWWGVTMIRLARKYKRFRDSEAASGDLEARAGEPVALPPGVPSQALRGIERAR